MARAGRPAGGDREAARLQVRAQPVAVPLASISRLAGQRRGVMPSGRQRQRGVPALAGDIAARPDLARVAVGRAVGCSHITIASPLGAMALSTVPPMLKSLFGSSSCAVCRASAAARGELAATLRSALIASVQVALLPLRRRPAGEALPGRCGGGEHHARAVAGWALQVLPQSMPTGCERTPPPPATRHAQRALHGGAAARRRSRCARLAHRHRAARAGPCRRRPSH